MEITDEEYNSYTPLFAYLGEKPEVQQDAILDLFGALSEQERKILVDVDTAQKLVDLAQQQVIPTTHIKAVAVLIAVVILGEAEPEQIGPLLEKVGLNSDVAVHIASVIQPIIAPALQARMMEKMQPMPVLNRPTESGPKPLIQKPAMRPIATPPSRNIIDLRKQQPPTT